MSNFVSKKNYFEILVSWKNSKEFCFDEAGHYQQQGFVENKFNKKRKQVLSYI